MAERKLLTTDRDGIRHFELNHTDLRPGRVLCAWFEHEDGDGRLSDPVAVTVVSCRQTDYFLYSVRIRDFGGNECMVLCNGYGQMGMQELLTIPEEQPAPTRSRVVTQVEAEE